MLRLVYTHLCFTQRLAVLECLHLECEQALFYGYEGTYNYAGKIIFVLFHQIEELHQNVVPMLHQLRVRRDTFKNGGLSLWLLFDPMS
jgi:hypothetical protein